MQGALCWCRFRVTIRSQTFIASRIHEIDTLRSAVPYLSFGIRIIMEILVDLSCPIKRFPKEITRCQSVRPWKPSYILEYLANHPAPKPRDLGGNTNQPNSWRTRFLSARTALSVSESGGGQTNRTTSIGYQVLGTRFQICHCNPLRLGIILFPSRTMLSIPKQRWYGCVPQSAGLPQTYYRDILHQQCASTNTAGGVLLVFVQNEKREQSRDMRRGDWERKYE